MPDDKDTAVLTREFVPQEFQGEEYIKPWLDKPWNKETSGEVFKKLVNAEKLVGKRPQVPGKDAKPEEWDSFLANLRPEKADDYEIPLPKDAKPDERGQAYIKALREAMHEAGIPKRSADKFIAKMTAFGDADRKTAQEKLEAARKKADLEFNTAATAALGAKKDEVMARVKAAIKENAPAVYKDRLDKLSNDDLLLVAGVVNSIMEKYVPADKLNAKPPSGGDGQGKDEDSALSEEGRTLMASKEFSDQFHPKHEQTRKRVEEIYRRIAEIRGGK